MSTSLSDLVPELEGPARDFVGALGVAGLLPQVTSTVRTRSEQRRLYDRFRRGLSRYPAARPGQSAHEYGLAFDLTCQDQETAGATWNDWGGFWSPSDAVHFELPGASALAAQQPAEAGIESFDPYERAHEFFQGNLVLRLLEPWQLDLYHRFPSIQYLINPLKTSQQVAWMFQQLFK